jgi:hypothetical protein
MIKIINPAKFEAYNGKMYNVYIKIQYIDTKLSISGVEGPTRDGNMHGSAGQILDNFAEYIPTDTWNRAMLEKLQAVWKLYHLNDLTPNCQHMRDGGLVKYTPGHVCQICGYKSGTKWFNRPVPADVIEWLESLPNTDKKPAWV